MAVSLAVLGAVLQVVFTFLAFMRLLVTAIMSPLSFYKTKRRDVPPACLMDPSLGNHEYVTANGIKFHCVTKGDRDKPLMLFLHGFPEFWYSWRYQLKEFCSDYRVVAIDMRGYGETDKPQGVTNYTMDLLKEDIVQLVKILSPSKKCILVAHDWGGIIAWRVVQNHPELFDKFIVMNCPHAKVYRRAISKGWKQLLKSWYIFFFQSPWLPETIMTINDYSQFDVIYRGPKMGIYNTDNFTDDDIEAFKFTFSPRNKLTPPINYYRNLLTPPTVRGKVSQKIDTPTLLIWGENDGALDLCLAQSDDYKDICSDLQIKHVPNCSHWVQQDCPQLTNQYMREFLKE